MTSHFRGNEEPPQRVSMSVFWGLGLLFKVRGSKLNTQSAATGSKIMSGVAKEYNDAGQILFTLSFSKEE